MQHLSNLLRIHFDLKFHFLQKNIVKKAAVLYPVQSYRGTVQTQKI